MKKRILLAVMLMCIGIFAVDTFSVSAASSGTCGENLTWTLDDDGTLTISGTGDMDSWMFHLETPWVEHRNRIKSIVIDDGVTSIGNYAFGNCSSLTSVTIPNSVTNIGISAFYESKNLTTVHINNLTAYLNCNYGGSYSNPMYYAKVLRLDGNLLKGSLEIPNGVVRIPPYAFNNCTCLTSVTIPDSVTSIGGNAFDGCDSLTRVNITDLKAWCNIDFGKGNVVKYYNGYPMLEVGWTNPLQHSDLYLNGELVTELIIPDGVSQIKPGAFYGYKKLTSVTIPDSVTSIGEDAFYDCSELTSINIANIGAWCNIDFKFYSSNPLYYAGNLYLNGKLVTNLVIPDGVTKISTYAFSDCSSLTSVTIPDSVTSIGDWAFSGCSSLTSVTIPDGVTSIGDYAFEDCESLTSVTIPDSVTSIGDWAFSGCRSLTSVTIPDSVTSIGNFAFDGCGSLTRVNITDLKAWCNIDFENYSSNPLDYAEKLYLNGELVENLVIPDGVTKISTCAFSGCSSITSVTIPSSMEVILDDAFYGCSDLSVVYYSSTDDDWANIYIAPGNDCLKNATRKSGVRCKACYRR